MSKKVYFSIIILVLAVAGILWWGYSNKVTVEPIPEPVVQNDNSQTSPIDTTPTGWLKETDEATGLTFRYPADFGTNYISVVDWPPKLEVLTEEFSCTEAGEETSRAGRTNKQIIGGREFCVTTESEGAAGSVYTMYAYGFDGGGETVVFTFSLKFVQCDNYDEPDQSLCKNERTRFDPGVTVSLIANSIKNE
ncbi:MAG: hypothetical protein A2672_01135 [Candidatus Wildermuthbacteria bacterium RIFCSPHIGHO2_01_FULL_49_22b]|uniref:Uncharacterized protein n=1 Tax=Candidatus Wildermuthbacteria bacterium RIFCSPHIGHO2_01_FULL_49_22b TaxID=1802448 RepID=A0A1G2R084_9BACT|nr:MAG: hypothetical protein A2672_01135 [Candidatus Wildermuthbacteria bacterium RIFCSPHIGHO2_01_FULL_49_22b]